ncbi:MAG: transporter substrate-binding domain-containing protein [Desulfovibrionaceae bacterium]
MRAFAFCLLSLVALTLLLPPCAVSAPPLPDPGGIRQVTAVGPSWETFTNMDGSGLYHEILNKVFGLYGITVRREYVPSERGLQLIANGEADFQTCYDRIDPPFVLARVPMYENAFHVLFNRQRIGAWQGTASLTGRKVVGRIGYYTPKNFDVPVLLHQVKTGVAALGMVVLGRMDFYVDDLALLEESIKQSPAQFDREAYDIQVAGHRAYFPVFATTERGRTVMALYESGMRHLHETGELKPIFQKWGHPYPHYEKYWRP